MTAVAPPTRPWPESPVVETATVELSEPCGAYRRLLLLAPETCRRSRAGQFVALSVGDDLVRPLRRFFTLVDVERSDGCVELLIAATSPATAWLGARRPGDVLDVFGPLGRPFPDPPPGARVLVVGGGHGGAGVYRATREAAAHGHEVHVVLGAADASRLFDPARFRNFASSLTVTTDDGSAGRRGSVLEAAGELLESGISPVYACGPVPMLAAVSHACAEAGATCWVACEVTMACAYSVCMACVLPMTVADGRSEMRRACVDGPVLRADRVRWADVGTVPADCVGA